MSTQQANSAFTAHNGGVDVLVDCFASNKVSGRVTYAVSTLLKLFSNCVTVRQVIVGTAGYEHVKKHVFSETFVTVERMKLPSGVHLDSQTVDNDADSQENNNCTGNRCDANC